VFTVLKYGKVAYWLRFWAVNHDTMGSNQATVNINFIFAVMSTHSSNIEYCSFSKCVAIVATIFFSLYRNGTLDIRFDMLIFC